MSAFEAGMLLAVVQIAGKMKRAEEMSDTGNSEDEYFQGQADAYREALTIIKEATNE